MRVVVINGSAETGKDKFVELFSLISKKQGYRVKNFSSIDKVKHIAELCFGWNGKKDEKSRKLLADVKHAWSEFNDGPFEDIKNRIDVDIKYSLDKKKDLSKNIYFVHIREPHEIKKIVEYFKDSCVTLLVRKQNKEVPNNRADTIVENYNYDYIVENFGTVKELKEKSKDFIKYLQQKTL